MSDRFKQKSAAVTSIVLGVVSVVMVGLMKHKLKAVPMISRFMDMKNLGIDSMKDFLEVSELDLRVMKNPVLHPQSRTKVAIEWNSDESGGYTVFISNSPITKAYLMNVEMIPEYKWDPLLIDLQEHWIRKEHVKTLDYGIEFDSAYCRIRSDNGRVSKEISFGIHSAGRHKGFRGEGALIKDEINCWLTQIDGEWYLHIIEPTETLKGVILAYQIRLYMGDGMGFIRSVEQFKGHVTIPLGRLKSCLCYIKGLRGIGLSIEQFVGWIEDPILTTDPELDKYTTPSF